LRRGSISGVDRKGRPYQFPLVALSIGVVNNQVRRSHTLREVSYLAAEAKCQAKQANENMYCRECETSGQELVAAATGGMSSTTRYALSPALAHLTLGRVPREPDIVNIREKKQHRELEQTVY
jgi:hypothetical protein